MHSISSAYSVKLSFVELLASSQSTASLGPRVTLQCDHAEYVGVLLLTVVCRLQRQQ